MTTIPQAALSMQDPTAISTVSVPMIDRAHLEPRCHVCRNDEVRKKVNDLLASGASYTMKQTALAAAMVTALGLGGVPSLAHADVCNDGAVKPGPGSGDWYQCQGGTWQYYPPPTFDADAEPCYPSLVSPEITEPYEAAVERSQRPAHSRQQRP